MNPLYKYNTGKHQKGAEHFHWQENIWKKKIQAGSTDGECVWSGNQKSQLGSAALQRQLLPASGFQVVCTNPAGGFITSELPNCGHLQISSAKYPKSRQRAPCLTKGFQTVDPWAASCGARVPVPALLAGWWAPPSSFPSITHNQHLPCTVFWKPQAAPRSFGLLSVTCKPPCTTAKEKHQCLQTLQIQTRLTLLQGLEVTCPLWKIMTPVNDSCLLKTPLDWKQTTPWWCLMVKGWSSPSP